MTSKTRSALSTEQTTNFADNTTGAITPAVLRSTVQDMIDSTGTLLDSNTWQGTAMSFTGSVAFSSPIAANAAGNPIGGSATNDSAAAGYVGEYIFSDIGSASAVALSTGTPSNITNIALSAGDWDVAGAICFQGGTTTLVSQLSGSMSSTSSTLDTSEGRFSVYPNNSVAIFIGGSSRMAVGPTRFSASASTTIYLVSQASFTTASAQSFGLVRARRMR